MPKSVPVAAPSAPASAPAPPLFILRDNDHGDADVELLQRGVPEVLHGVRPVAQMFLKSEFWISEAVFTKDVWQMYEMMSLNSCVIDLAGTGPF